MGSGAFANLQRHVAPDAVDAVVISHLHADHMLDLLPYRYWLDFEPGGAARRPRLLLPPGAHEVLLRISGVQDSSPTFFSGLFDVTEYDPTQPAAIGALTITFHAMQHAPHTYGLRVEGAATLAYSADSGPSPVLSALARDADLFLCENANAADNEYAMHLTARQAGSYAREAGAQRFVLPHPWHRFGL